MGRTPYIGFSNETLGQMPRIGKGDRIKCPKCGGSHEVTLATDELGVENDLLMFYSCGDVQYLAGIDGRAVAGVKPDCSGDV